MRRTQSAGVWLRRLTGGLKYLVSLRPPPPPPWQHLAKRAREPGKYKLGYSCGVSGGSERMGRGRWLADP